MKGILLLFGMLLVGTASLAQGLQINPSVEWKYIRSADVTLTEGVMYQYEVPAEKGYDYLINVAIEESNIEPFIKVYDLQMKPLEANTEDGFREQMIFRVTDSGTYIISLAYRGPIEDDGTTSVNFTLIRRPIVD